jgi:hypothetical protein
LVFIEVEKCYFVVPRRWFEVSPVFCKIFELENTTVDGSNIERPFRLGDINRADFKPLLELMAPRSASLVKNVNQQS